MKTVLMPARAGHESGRASEPANLMTTARWRHGHARFVLLAAIICAMILAVPLANGVRAQSVRPPSNAVDSTVSKINIPTNTQRKNSISNFWRQLRHGEKGFSTTEGGRPTAWVRGGRLIQAEGEQWRLIHNRYIMRYSGPVLLVTLGLLALFFLLRGRIGIEGGRSGRTIARFSLMQRIVHWFTAGVLIFLAFTGLILLFGRTALLPLIGKSANAVLTSAAMQGHNLFGPLFIVALVWLFFAFLRGNFLDLADLRWIARAGGLFGGHASSGRYNFGEKFWFWFLSIIGLAMAATGTVLEFPWIFPDLWDMQLATLVHAIGAISLIALALGHIYIGTIGMEGALESMTTGEVDEAWARQHHDLWFEEITGRPLSDHDGAPAEQPQGGVTAKAESGGAPG